MRIRYTIMVLVSLLLVDPAFAADGEPTAVVPAKVAPTKIKVVKRAVPKKVAKVVVPTKVPVAPVAVPEEPTKAEEPKEVPVAPVAAVKTTEVTWWKVLVSHAMELAFALLGLMLTIFVRVLMKKYGFESEATRVNTLLSKAVGYAEQKAVAAAKLEEGKKTSGAEKMELAVQFAEKLAVDYKLPVKAKDWWEDRLEAWMGVTKKNGVSA